MTFAENLIQLRIASQLEFIDLVTSLTDNLSALAGFDEDSVYGINMAVRESVANAVEHGNRYDPNKPVEINFHLGGTDFSIRVRDHGEGFDPSDLPDPLDPANLLNPAGRGILYMRSFMDIVDYERHPEGGMIVTMIKVRVEKGGEASAAGDEGENKQDAAGN